MCGHYISLSARSHTSRVLFVWKEEMEKNFAVLKYNCDNHIEDGFWLFSTLEGARSFLVNEKRMSNNDYEYDWSIMRLVDDEDWEVIDG